jgi:hypothetical protein
MPSKYLHDLTDFPDLLSILERDTGILAYLIEKDYWIMHVLHGLKNQGFEFELKGGTSLSKGFGIIDRFSEDIDIHIKPPAGYEVNTNPKNTNANAVKSRKNYYDRLAGEIKIEGITSVTRDTEFDNTKTYNSGGIRLLYHSYNEKAEGVKEGILLEAGFDNVTPNQKLTISSWTYERAAATKGIEIYDNRAVDIPCYHPGYTFVEKLQTITTKFRQEQEDEVEKQNLMRQYYDVYSLLANEDVQNFIGTEKYIAHKEARFSNKDKEIPIAENQAFLLESQKLRSRFKERYEATKKLYYNGQPPFDEVLERIKANLPNL